MSHSLQLVRVLTHFNDGYVPDSCTKGKCQLKKSLMYSVVGYFNQVKETTQEILGKWEVYNIDEQSEVLLIYLFNILIMMKIFRV